MRLAAIEGGGTTWVCAIAVDAPDNFVERAVFPTADPETTLGQVREWLRSQTFDAIGIASFGPIDAKIGSSTFGYITSTPKPKWGNTNVVGLLGLYDEFKQYPFMFDTDVNAPALAEYTLHGKAASLTSCAYITVGTGIGVGFVINGQTVKGMMHPEAGHIQVKRCPGDEFPGSCPFHGDCVEGMCSTGALCGKANCSPHDLPNLSDDDIVWEHCAFYIAQLCATMVMVASPELICIGGGVLNRASLYPRIRTQTLKLLNGYIQNELLTEERIHEFIKPSYW
jgi:fructokinase